MMDWSEWNRILTEGMTESWKCSRALNDRGSLLVYRIGNLRYRSDRKQRTTESELVADGWILSRMASDPTDTLWTIDAKETGDSWRNVGSILAPDGPTAVKRYRRLHTDMKGQRMRYRSVGLASGIARRNSDR